MSAGKINLKIIRHLVKTGRYSVRQHAHQRMIERDIFTDDIENVILLGEVVETDQHNKPLPTCLLMNFVCSQPLYVVCALSKNWVYIITVYWFDPSKWINPWIKR